MTKILRTLVFATALAVPAVASFAQVTQDAPYMVVETGRKFTRLQDAVNAIGSGHGTIRFASRSFADCAIQADGDITYIAAAPGEAILDGVACEGKAALVLRGRSARIEGLTFANIKVPDANGAGIRLEKGNLTIQQTWFRDSEQGILTADDPASSIVIDKTTFSRLGRCDRGLSCAHSIYVNDYGSLTVTRSRFEAGRGGHYVKSRSARIDVNNSSFDDSQGKTTNYMIDLSTGATGRITDNVFVQGRDKENHSAFIAVSAEGKTHSSSGLTVEGNDARMAPGVPWGSVFVADWSGAPLNIGTNRLGPSLQRFEKR